MDLENKNTPLPPLHAAANKSELDLLLRAHQNHHEKIGHVLLKKNIISAQTLSQALYLKKKSPEKRLGEILVDICATTQPEIQSALLAELAWPTVLLGEFDFDPQAISLLTADMARDLGVIPLMFHDDALVFAVSNAPKSQTLELLRFTVGRPISFALSTQEEIDRAIYLSYQTFTSVQELASLEQTSIDLADQQSIWKDAEQLAKKAPLVKLVDWIIRDAINQHASDIHIRPSEKCFDLLYRIDGTLVNIRQIKSGLLPAVVNRIKILSSLNIAEHRLPQDGRIRIRECLQIIDLRISIIPVQYGESVVIRILNKSEGLRSINEIGFNSSDQEKFVDLIKRSYGIVLVTGPTGSGKSTTLYAALQEVERENVNVITVEDPIEYELANTRQIQVIDQISFGFPQALRHILRHDPDVIMIGEMRDVETCKIAVESALTGHLVFSTLHTNDAPGALVRLMEIGIAAYMIRSAVIGVLAQRLVRRNCEHCLCEEVVPPLMRKNLGLADSEIFYCGAGCEHCRHTGFKGRMAIYELLVMNDELREHVQEGVSSDVFRSIAMRNGMMSLPANGVEQARSRKVSIAEVYRACM